MSAPENDGSDDSDEPPKVGNGSSEELVSTSRIPSDNLAPRTNDIPIITRTDYLDSVPSSDSIPIQPNNLNVLHSANSLARASVNDGQLSRQTPIPDIASYFEEDSIPYNSRRRSTLNYSDTDEPPVVTIFKSGNSFDYGEDSAVSLYSPPHSPPVSVLGPTLAEPVRPRRVSSTWSATLSRLTAEVSKDEKNIARKVYLGGSSSEDSAPGTPTETNKPVNPTALRRLLSRAPGISNLSTKLYLVPNSPFYYMYRPFRRPPLAPVDPNPVVTSSKHDLPDFYPFSFPPVNVSSYDWINIPRTSDTFVAVKQWTNPEPSATEAILPADADPLVLYKMERMGIGAGDKVKMKDMKRLQRNITLGQTISGRKLDGFGSSDEEWIYTRVRCKDEPDFDLLHHLDFGQEGKWPNPYFFYWNWRQLKDGVDENYIKDPSRLNTTRAKIVEELDKSPKIIPYYRLNANDTESSDPEDPTVPHVTDPGNPYSLRWKFNEVREAVTDPVERRYPYLYLHLQGKFYNRFYACKRALHAIKRCGIATLLGFWNRRRAPWFPYPIWYLIWKFGIRYAIQQIPRKLKFLSENECDTIFYGTLATLYQTQFIAEFDILPTMIDPVEVSQIALEKALKIKEKFLSHRSNHKAYVDYLKMQRSKLYETHLEWIGLLCRFQPDKLSPTVRKVFFINYFNVLSIQTQIWRIPEIENMDYLWEIKDFWEKTKGLCGCIELNLEEIYHGILRCNKPHPTKQAPVLYDNDDDERMIGIPREFLTKHLGLERLDPRIHFALNIGCKSCPPIQIFSLHEHECQLDEVAKNYVRTRVKIDVNRRIVKLPILFLWYEEDFGKNRRVMLWYLKRFLLAKDALKIRKLVTSRGCIWFHYESFDYQLDPYVRRHPSPACVDVDTHRKAITTYWGINY